MPKKRRRWDLEPEREPGQSPTPQLARLDTASRVGVLEDLQRSGGNNAVQHVLGGAQLQRDTTTLRRSSSVAQRFALTIDGTTVPVAAVDGGGARGDVIVEAPRQGGVSGKHLAGLRFDEVSLQLGLELGPLGDWIGSTLGNKHSRKDIVIHQLDTSSGKEVRSVEFHDCLVTRIGVPKLDVADSGEAWLNVRLQPEFVRTTSGSGQTAAGKAKPDALKPSTARLEISGIGGVSELLSVDGFAFTATVKADEVGKSRTPVLTPGSTHLDNLVVTAADTGKKSGKNAFDAWFEESAIRGNREERTAVLTVKSHGGKTLTLTFSGVGLAAAEMFGSSAGGGRKYELYAESVSLKIA